MHCHEAVQAIKFVKENYKTHALRNAFIYLTAAVKKCGAPQKEIDDAVQEYRSERRKVDDYRYGDNQGFSKFESAFYEDNYSKSFKICNREITTLEKLLEGQETRVNLNQKKYMHHWAKCTQQLAVMMAADVGCWQTNRLKYDEMQYMRKSSRGYVIEHKDKKLQFRTNSASILVRNQTLLRETCSVCEKKIASKSHLKIHMRLHTGEKPYQCTNCNARFRDRSNFNKHKMTHEAETGSEDDSA
ncbi:Zinc finger protein 81 [Frankliniella fusca]|uniref:Zinc finger protein 81 n=1 Tax=Frankliniella fusca TaxID=407009 RepID=A0AAE1I338_9NEOP|nr:Zinc finger protein 81 [Frankliniella fusca]